MPKTKGAVDRYKLPRPSVARDMVSLSALDRLDRRLRALLPDAYISVVPDWFKAGHCNPQCEDWGDCHGYHYTDCLFYLARNKPDSELTVKRNTRIIERHQQGINANQLAEQFHMSKRTIQRVLSTNGVIDV